jgi:hypothetical protein
MNHRRINIWDKNIHYVIPAKAGIQVKIDHGELVEPFTTDSFESFDRIRMNGLTGFPPSRE